MGGVIVVCAFVAVVVTVETYQWWARERHTKALKIRAAHRAPYGGTRSW